MSKRIILLSDGTGNSAAKVWRTNVRRVFEALDLSTSDQLAFYDDGVGTSSFKPLAILGGMFGLGLRRNVLSLYKSLSRNYQPGDEIYAFGFSRGAFTIRVLVDIVLSQGLVESDTEAELNQKAYAAYRAYRREKFKATVWKRLALRVFSSLGYTSNRLPKIIARPVEKIRFLGLWDTVAAYGLPMDEMTRG